MRRRSLVDAVTISWTLLTVAIGLALLGLDSPWGPRAASILFVLVATRMAVPVLIRTPDHGRLAVWEWKALAWGFLLTWCSFAGFVATSVTTAVDPSIFVRLAGLALVASTMRRAGPTHVVVACLGLAVAGGSAVVAFLLGQPVADLVPDAVIAGLAFASALGADTPVAERKPSILEVGRLLIWPGIAGVLGLVFAMIAISFQLN